MKWLVLGAQKKLGAPLWARCRAGGEFSFSASPSGTFLLQRTSFQRDVVTTQTSFQRVVTHQEAFVRGLLTYLLLSEKACF